jgi:hypothetical protein
MTREEIEVLVSDVPWEMELDYNPNKPDWYQSWCNSRRRDIWRRDKDWRDEVNWEFQECWETLPIESRIAIYININIALRQTEKMVKALKP